VSQHFAIPRPGVRLTAQQLVLAKFAAGLARAATRLPPRRLAAVMRLLSRGVPAADYDQVRRSWDTVVRASLICARNDGCLPRSIATALVCRAAGYWPTWCVGVRVHPPFGAHAWVEADGRVVGEDLAAKYFRRLVVVPPCIGPVQ
jgi:Transglutaminase-like superfamily